MLKEKRLPTNINVLITGHTAGLGFAIASHYLDDNARVFGLSRSFSKKKHPKLSEVKLDLSCHSDINPALESFKLSEKQLDLVFLNAGELGEIKPLSESNLDDLQKTMDINVWSNKYILDWLIQKCQKPKQIILISSGASVNANYGWGAYSISKACLNTMAKLYSHEFPNSHISAVAPGLVDTKMQKSLREKNSTKFPSLKKMHSAYEKNQLQSSQSTAKILIGKLDEIFQLNSGSYVDLRNFP